MNDHPRHEEQVAPYLLSALPDADERDFERHLAGCADCRAEADRLRPAADALPRSVTPLAAPPRIKRSLMDTVEREAAERRGERPRRSPGERLGMLLPETLRLRPAVLAGAAVVLAALVFAAGFGVAQLGDESRTLSASVDDRRAPAGSGQLVTADGTGGTLRVRGMPEPRGGFVYQAWVKRRGEVVPQDTFEVGEDGSGAVGVEEDLQGAEAVLVTREPPSGSRRPSGPPVMRVTL